MSDKILDIRGCSYAGKDLSGKTLAGALMVDTDMSNTNLSEAVLTKVGACLRPLLPGPSPLQTEPPVVNCWDRAVTAAAVHSWGAAAPSIHQTCSISRRVQASQLKKL